ARTGTSSAGPPRRGTVRRKTRRGASLHDVSPPGGQRAAVGTRVVGTLGGVVPGTSDDHRELAARELAKSLAADGQFGIRLGPTCLHRCSPRDIGQARGVPGGATRRRYRIPWVGIYTEREGRRHAGK